MRHRRCQCVHLCSQSQVKELYHYRIVTEAWKVSIWQFKHRLCISSITYLLGNFLAVDRKHENFVFRVCFESTMTTDGSNYFLTEGSLKRDNYCSCSFRGYVLLPMIGLWIYINKQNQYFLAIPPGKQTQHCPFLICSFYIKESYLLYSIQNACAWSGTDQLSLLDSNPNKQIFFID